jgi:hypothetical protein
MKRGVLYAVLCCIACVGFVGWRIHVLANHSAPQFEIVVERKRSSSIWSMISRRL